MSNDPIRVTFPNGFVCYGYGDCGSFAMPELFETQDEAYAAYCSKDNVSDSSTKMECAKKTAVQVTAETTYGQLDFSYKPMFVSVWASQQEMLVTQASYDGV